MGTRYVLLMRVLSQVNGTLARNVTIVTKGAPPVSGFPIHLKIGIGLGDNSGIGPGNHGSDIH
jgi:hypothetical protein